MGFINITLSKILWFLIILFLILGIVDYLGDGWLSEKFSKGDRKNLVYVTEKSNTIVVWLVSTIKKLLEFVAIGKK